MNMLKHSKCLSLFNFAKSKNPSRHTRDGQEGIQVIYD